MFGMDESILFVFAAIFALGILTLDFSVFEKLKRKLAEKVANQTGLYDVYFDVCTTQTLELIQSLRYHEDDFCESLVDLVAETLSLPEMLLILTTTRVSRVLKPVHGFPSLTAQAQSLAHFYIDVAKHRLTGMSPPSGPHAHRLSSRWRRRSI